MWCTCLRLVLSPCGLPRQKLHQHLLWNHKYTEEVWETTANQALQNLLASRSKSLDDKLSLGAGKSGPLMVMISQTDTTVTQIKFTLFVPINQVVVAVAEIIDLGEPVWKGWCAHIQPHCHLWRRCLEFRKYSWVQFSFRIDHGHWHWIASHFCLLTFNFRHFVSPFSAVVFFHV